MGHNNAASNTRVLELGGSGSRTNSQNTERLIRYLDSLGAEPSTPRPMEAVWALIALVLFSAYLESTWAPVEQAVAKEARGCISQYGPGERYARPKPEKCAPMVEAPNSILTMPLAENK